MTTTDPFDPMDDARETWRVIDQEKRPWLDRDWRRGHAQLDREIQNCLETVEGFRLEATSTRNGVAALDASREALAFMERAIALATGRATRDR